jgi:hypothetical protein
MKKKIRIRQMTVADIETLIEWANAVDFNYSPVSILAEYRTAQLGAFTAEPDGEIAGRRLQGPVLY